MHKKLFIPGPVEVREEVLEKMATPMIGHRSKEASQLQRRISDNLRKLFFTNNEILLSTTSGSGLMEGAIRSCTLKKAAVFSKKAKEEMKVYSTALRDILERTTNAFVDGDEALARTVEPLEEVIDELNKTVKKNHMKRLRKGKCTIELGLVLSDLAMNYERVADHCSNIAVYMMQLEDTQLEEHSFTEQLDAEESAEFTKQLNEFEKIYQI